MRPALFLDRDGVVNIDHGYVHQPEQVDFVDGIFELVRRANRAGFAVVIVTNQAGIARGLYTEESFREVSNWMMKRFVEAGARIDALYHCPHHPTDGLGALKQVCGCRKPAPGMLLQAIRELSLSPEHSVLVGDSMSDIEAGLRAGVRGLFLLVHGNEFKSDPVLHPYMTTIRELRDARLTSNIEGRPQSNDALA